MVAEYRALWTVPGGGAGYSSFFSLADTNAEAQQMADAVRALFSGVSTYIPSGVSIAFESEARVLSTGSGQLTSILPVTAPAQVSGAATGAYAGGSGVRIDWRTSDIVAGRRVVGRTFLVPIIGSAYENNGTILAAVLTDLQSDADAYISAGQGTFQAVVWHRPVNGAGGSTHNVETANIPDKTALLRTRRD